jgi:hypothetical protein
MVATSLARRLKGSPVLSSRRTSHPTRLFLEFLNGAQRISDAPSNLVKFRPSP